MIDVKQRCKSLDTHETLAELDMLSEEILYWKESGREFGKDDYGLTLNDIWIELGPIYKETFKEMLNGRDEPDFIRDYKNTDVGDNVKFFMRELNRLAVRVKFFSIPDIDNSAHAIESVVNKILVHNGLDETIDLGGQDISSSEACLEIIRTTSYETQKKLFREGKSPESLLNKLQQPLMTTKLWPHQEKALSEWINNNMAGYVDMATATGKTVLGLGTIASLYGELHPDDQGMVSSISKQSREEVLIVAHDTLVLEQWGNEFDRHLQIPRQFTGFSEKEELTDIKLNWGRIRFVTSQKFRNMISEDINKISHHDLIILDEIHKYHSVVGKISHLINQGDTKLIALSGSVDMGESKGNEIKNHLDLHLPLLKRYTLEMAEEDGIIPDFSCRVIYAPPHYDDEQKEKLKTIKNTLLEKYNEIQESDLFPEFDGYQHAKIYSYTEDGITQQRDIGAYRDYLRTYQSRWTRLRHVSPAFDGMIDVLKEEGDTRKCLVLLSKNSHIQIFKDRLISETDLDEDRIWTVGGEGRKAHEQKKVIDDFDKSEGPGVLIGTGTRLGVGVDFLNLEVVVNASSGYKVNKSLVQRMGRMLRDIEGKKENPTFYNFVPLLIDEDVSIANRDGRLHIEGAAQYLGFAHLMGIEPGDNITFTTSKDSLKSELSRLEKEGIDYINKLIEKGNYQEPTVYGKDKENKKSSTTYLKKEILDSQIEIGKSILLEKWGEKKKKDLRKEGPEEEEREVKRRKITKKKESIEKDPPSKSLTEKVKGIFKKMKNKLG